MYDRRQSLTIDISDDQPIWMNTEEQQRGGRIRIIKLLNPQDLI